mmetsp:Transcript_1839/g.5834  ORF Transcript_1839/g.5834 Transcript_1839/m.5834 type:complete len:464 (+) Transcript_1839:111-1502(+)
MHVRRPRKPPASPPARPRARGSGLGKQPGICRGPRKLQGVLVRLVRIGREPLALLLFPIRFCSFLCLLRVHLGGGERILHQEGLRPELSVPEPFHVLPPLIRRRLSCRGLLHLVERQPVVSRPPGQAHAFQAEPLGQALLLRLDGPPQRLEDLLPAGDHGHGGAQAADAAGAATPMHKLVNHVRQLVVHHVCDILHVQAAGGYVGGHQYLSLTIAHSLHRAAPLSLRHTTMADHDSQELLPEVLIHLGDRVPPPAEDNDRRSPELSARQHPVQLDQAVLRDRICLQLDEREIFPLHHLVLNKVTVAEQHAPAAAHSHFENAPPALAGDDLVPHLELPQHAVRGPRVHEDVLDGGRNRVGRAARAVHPDALLAEECLCEAAHGRGDGGGPEGRLPAARHGGGHAALLHNLLQLTAEAELHHAVHLVEDEVPHPVQLAHAPVQRVHEPPRRGHQDVRTVREVSEL